MDPFKNKIAEGLRKLRVEKNWSQEYVAERLGKTDASGYNRLEIGRTELKFEDAYKLAKLYKVPMEMIFNPELKKEMEFSILSDRERTPYGKANEVQMTVKLDGSMETLERQFDLLRDFNKVLQAHLE